MGAENRAGGQLVVKGGGGQRSRPLADSPLGGRVVLRLHRTQPAHHLGTRRGRGRGQPLVAQTGAHDVHVKVLPS